MPPRPTSGRPESPALATIDDTLARLIGIRISVAIIADRARRHLTADDWRELHTILDLANDIQDDHLTLRAIVSRAYQSKDPAPETPGHTPQGVEAPHDAAVF